MNVEGKNWVMKDCLSIVIICRNVRWMSDSFEIQIKLGTLELALSLELSVSFQSAFCLLAQRIVSLSSFFRSKANTISRLKNICCHYTAFCMCCLLLVFFLLIWWANEWLLAAGFVTFFSFSPLLSSHLISLNWHRQNSFFFVRRWLFERRLSVYNEMNADFFMFFEVKNR